MTEYPITDYPVLITWPEEKSRHAKERYCLFIDGELVSSGELCGDEAILAYSLFYDLSDGRLDRCPEGGLIHIAEEPLDNEKINEILSRSSRS